MSKPVVFEDIFEVLAADPGGKHFDKVTRFQCHSDLYEMDLMLDINTSIYPLHEGDKFSLALAKTVNLDNTPTDGTFNAQMQSKERASLMDTYEYVMFGRIFKYEDTPSGANNQMRVQVFISFGGLLLQLTGDLQKLQELEVDANIYLLMRKV
ncbi:g4120 [Coccomyxa viridis]|uniref:G4120 protein n=1 Tax=Coccomyxa viridis TaxID=1274662 RepID=A0ABP1FPI6_9CHLO